MDTNDLFTTLFGGILSGSALAMANKDMNSQSVEDFKAKEEKKVDVLVAILEELQAIRKDTEIMKEALLYQPGGPGAEAAREHFHDNQ